MEADDFWSDQARANSAVSEVSELRSWVKPCDEMAKWLEDVEAILEDAIELADEELLSDIDNQLKSKDAELSQLETRRMLSGELDKSACFLSINSGAGGTESCDWAQMLMRMYSRWAAKKGYKVSLVDQVDGEVAGIKSATLHFEGPFAYGYTKAERGVHRLVRISPFDSQSRRHTSFASVDVTPEVSDELAVEISPQDLRIDTFRSSGAGGQHVNTTDSAVRITHIPTGIVASCQNERSQIQNRAVCLKMIQAKLYEKEVADRKAKIESLGGEKKDNSWGSQIRSYVFAPYQLVKDNRTKVETGQVSAVMDGEIDLFIEAYLKAFGEDE
jgi:peptide chain release factor 2